MNSTSSAARSNPIANDNLSEIAIYVNHVIISQILAIFGMGSNVVNISVFYRMGFKESINVSLFGLAISDFMSCLTHIWSDICFTPSFYQLDLPFKALELKYVTADIPHLLFIKITSCITVYIIFERCLCVTFPLKVKSIITPKRVTIYIVCIYTTMLLLFAPAFYVAQPAWKFYPNLNKSLVGIVFSDDRWEIEKWMHPITGVFLFWFLFIFIVFTAILVVTLKRKSEWRKKAAGTSDSNQMSSRDAKVAKLVVFLAVVFITCFIPNTVGALVMSADSDFSVGVKYSNVLSAIFSFIFVFEAINAALNDIFIYYFRSSRYKMVFNQIILRKTTSD